MADHLIGDGSWTYGDDPESTPRDEVRMHCGDNVSTQKFLTDNEIDYCIAKEPTNELAGAKAAELIAFKLAREMSQGAEGFSGSLDQRRIHFLDTAKKIRKMYGQAVPEVGGIDDADNEALDDEADIVLPKFKLGMHDHPETYDDPQVYDQEE